MANGVSGSIMTPIYDTYGGICVEFQFARRMEQFQPGSFNVLDDKRRELEATCRRVYNLSIGTPDFPPAPHVVQALCQAASKPENYKYARTECPGLVEGGVL